MEGLAKAAAARVMSLAGGGQTLLTRGAFDLAYRAAGDEEMTDSPLDWLSHGLYEFQGLGKPMETCEVRAGNLERAVELFEEVTAEQPSPYDLSNLG